MVSERLLLCAGLGLTWALMLLPRLALGATFAETEVRASYLYNFAKYTEWPESGRENFSICALNDEPLARALKGLEGKDVGKKRLSVAHLSSLASVRECQILFIGSADTYRLDKILDTLGNAPTLTVSSAPVLDRVNIVLVLDNNRMVFDVNLEAYRRAGLQPNSTLLRLARQIRKGP